MRNSPLIYILIIVMSMGVFHSSCFSQYQLYLGVHAGWNANFFQIQPKDPNLQNGIAFVPLMVEGCINLRIGKTEHFIEGEFHRFNHFLKIQVLEDELGLAPSFATLSNLGLGVKGRYGIIQNRLFVFARGGVEIGLDRGGGLKGSASNNTSLGILTYQVDLPVRSDQIIPFLYGGLGIETQFRNGMILSFNATYHQGLKKVIEDEITYAFNNDPPTSLSLFTRGSHLPVQLGLSYPISRIWEGKILMQ